jgi:hypothetical protein
VHQGRVSRVLFAEHVPQGLPLFGRERPGFEEFLEIVDGGVRLVKRPERLFLLEVVQEKARKLSDPF